MIQSICIHSKNFYSEKYPSFFGFCCCSVSQSCLTLCNPMDCSTPGLPVLHYLLEFGQTHVHWVDDAIQPSLSPPSLPTLSLSQHQGLFQRDIFSHQVAKLLSFSFSISPSKEYVLSIKSSITALLVAQKSVTGARTRAAPYVSICTCLYLFNHCTSKT